jgi:UDP-glucose 4-epimerase
VADTALVTGGAGFLGSHVVDELVRRGIRPVVLDDLSGGFKENVHPDAEFVEGSILDALLIERLFTASRFRYIYHFAAYAAEGLSHFIKRFNYENNLIGSVNLINAAINHDVECFVFTSSIAVYGTQPLPMTEDMTPVPEDPYGVAKLAVERELAVSHEQFGLNFVVFRPHNIYGARQNIGDRYRNVIGIFMNQIMQGRELTIFGDGEQTRAFSHVSEVAPVIGGCVSEPASYGQVFNIGSDDHCSVRKLATMVSEAMGVEPRLRHLPARNEVQHAFCSHEKVKRYFRVPPPVDLAAGLSAMASWAKRVGPRTTRPFVAIEVDKKLPAVWRGV